MLKLLQLLRLENFFTMEKVITELGDDCVILSTKKRMASLK